MKKQDVQKETYFRTMFKRQNVVKNFIISLFESSTSFGRLIIEVFIRKNMGRRYFKLSGAIITAFFLFLVPFLPMVFPIFLNSYYAPSFWGTIKEYWMWYLFIALFLYFSYLRFKDIKHLKAVYDFDHFSLSSGDILPFYWQLKYNGKPISPRTLEIFIEPLPFFFGGIFLMLIGQKLLGALIFLVQLCTVSAMHVPMQTVMNLCSIRSTKEFATRKSQGHLQPMNRQVEGFVSMVKNLTPSKLVRIFTRTWLTTISSLQKLIKSVKLCNEMA